MRLPQTQLTFSPRVGIAGAGSDNSFNVEAARPSGFTPHAGAISFSSKNQGGLK